VWEAKYETKCTQLVKKEYGIKYSECKTHTALSVIWFSQNDISIHTSVVLNTRWGKIPSLLSVGHCEGRGDHKRVGLGSKGAGSREVPVTTFPSHKDGVVQWAARICRRNPLFAKSLYRSGAACVPYSLPNPPSGLHTRPKIHSVVGFELQGNGKCV